MAVLASKTSYPSSMGMGSNSTTSVGPYPNTVANYRTPAIGSSRNGPFASPTESEFSESYDPPDSVR